MIQIIGDNVPKALEEGLHLVKHCAVEEPSRNGPVFTFVNPVVLTVYRPWERVLVDPVRNANPFFHLAEFVWMMAGSNDVKFVERFNARMREYADPGTDVHHGAYGHRWRNHFHLDQIRTVSGMLKKDPTTRRALLGMWDPSVDLDTRHNDLPCNTHIYLRVVDGGLNFTVCNRSNDMLWGMLGANTVHMTMLHELLARSIGVPQGTYFVFTNNLHVYKDRADVRRLLDPAPHPIYDQYRAEQKKIFPLLQSSESLYDFLNDCENYVANPNQKTWRTDWFHEVFIPVMKSFEARKLVGEIAADDWRQACSEWLDRGGKVGTPKYFK